jgi:hypothetical protein
VHERWARLRFSIIGALLAAPPAKGALRAALQQLAAREWRHPSTGAPVRFRSLHVGTVVFSGANCFAERVGTGADNCWSNSAVSSA